MRVYESHLVKESSCDTDDHVLDVRAYGTNTCELFTVGEPQVNLDEFLFDFFAFVSNHLVDNAAFHRNVLELTLESSERTLDTDLTGGDDDLDYIIK
jgi:hypothetical protein